MRQNESAAPKDKRAGAGLRPCEFLRLSRMADGCGVTGFAVESNECWNL
jgi:hypothetical protein